jgi:hypothetical protein
MHIIKDIREMAYLSERQVQKLNFVKDSKHYSFRKFYRSGLRSHIFEVLLKKDIEKEIKGEVIEGIRMFPRAKPKKMFRILRNRFKSSDAVFHEIEKYRVLLKYLGPSFIARSEEFIVDYTQTGTSQIVLCGLQEYVEGQILDPWRIVHQNYLEELFMGKTHWNFDPEILVSRARKSIAIFVEKIRDMIKATAYIPDLAGIGNLILTTNGDLKLVDINNIVKIKLTDEILIDDKGYPSCDISVAVLQILENKILQKSIQDNDPLYRFFLSKERKKKVKILEENFYNKLEEKIF